ncbi:MAG: PAS domain-containing protein, partial [Scytonema sp. PMC 1069.18]|nr:PAS domain-containing protein [Scytonema sp. PMC 1069.18]
MNDKEKTKEQLIEELTTLRQRLADLEKQAFQQQQAIQLQQNPSTLFRQGQPKQVKSQQVDLQDNNHFLQRIVETTPDIIYVYDLVEKRNIYANHQIFELLGYTSLQIQAMKEAVLPSLIHPDDWVRVQEHLKRFETLNQGEVIKIEYRMKQANGKWRWLRSQETVFATNADGLPIQILGTARDIDERKRAVAALQESEERFRSMADTAPVMIWMSGTDKGCTFCNKKWLEFTGCQREQEIDYGWTEFIHPDDLQVYLETYTTAFDSRQSYTMELRLRRCDGEYRWILDTGSPRFDADGSFAGYIGSCVDITEQKQTLQALQESEARWKLALEAARMTTWDWNIATNKVIDHNPMEMLSDLPLGCSEHSFEDFINIVHPEDRDFVVTALRNAIENGANYDVEFRIVCDNGSIHWIGNKGQVLRDRTDNPIRMIGVATDITEKKQLQAQLFRTQRLESLGTLASGIAHDLGNILSPILMSAQLLQMQITDEETQVQVLLETLQTNAQRGAALVKQVLSFARGVEGKRTNLQIKHLILEFQQFAKQTFPKSIEFSTKIASDLWTVYADATQLHQVLMNLVINARDAMPHGGELRICAENFWIDENYAKMHLEATVGPHIMITVKDTGIGMSPEILDRIFEPFFTTKDIGKGTGLGLSTVLGIIKSHGGFVNVSSSVGKGTQFQIFLKAVTENQTQPVEDLELPAGNDELILVVDDEPKIRETVKTALAAYNYRVMIASNGIE